MVHIDPNILFTRLTAIVQNEDDIAAQFYYELTPEPTTLFKDGLMRKSSKSDFSSKHRTEGGGERKKHFS